MKVLLVLCCALAIFTSSTNDERAVENIDNLPSTTKEKLDAGTNACAPTPTHEHSERRSQCKEDEQSLGFVRLGIVRLLYTVTSAQCVCAWSHTLSGGHRVKTTNSTVPERFQVPKRNDLAIAPTFSPMAPLDWTHAGR
jgi:hypothetical protein